MKATKGDKIKVKRNVYYGSAYGLIEIKEGTILTVADRNPSGDGIVTVETIVQSNVIGTRTIPYNVWDRDYIIIRNN